MYPREREPQVYTISYRLGGVWCSSQVRAGSRRKAEELLKRMLPNAEQVGLSPKRAREVD
ncbi:hypothetical protein [Aeromonas phage PVN05]|nr:hypothetical protein [Aeromonas phage PVN05]